MPAPASSHLAMATGWPEMFVTLDRFDTGVAVVTLNRPERMNALSVDLAGDLLKSLDAIAIDPAIGAVVLTGAGRGFCAGGDVKEMELNRDKTLAQRQAELAMMHRIPERIAGMPQVFVAAVNGVAYGAGFAIVLTCDIAFTSQGARFGTAFLKQGLVSDFGLSYQLTRLAGPAAARRVIFLDQVLSAQEAISIGLVSEIHSDEALKPAAIAAAEKIARWPGEARQEMKTLLRRAETATHREMLDREAEVQGRLIVSEDHAKAVDAFNASGSGNRNME